MPKTTKRAATKRAAKIAKAHATELPKLDVKEEAKRRAPGYKPPARGIARYPWATFFVLLVIIGLLSGTYYAYHNHLGPFKLPPAKPKAAVSPCLSSTVLKEVTDTAPAPTAAQFKQIQHTYKQAPAMSINTKAVYCAGINTNRGLIVLELDPSLAPHTVNNFVFLAQHHFYDGLVFHRVVPGFVIQTGDPTGKGTGGPGYKFNDEPVKGNYTEGCVAMANSGPNTNGSQFFICTGNDTTKLTKSYNLFGHVVQGMNVALKIQGPGDTASSKNIKPDVINHLVVVKAP
ncbi:MAG TPA: peptidylprolyl isomerase [Ktedonobacteraceae bacterium]|nr:peptidylprolyl isomerase [Ktedonobacteraceae bacterium]